ncbi:MAG TPA: DnaJ domain-containing protein [Candidatus Limnocylindria bacterium]|nr:DnaJ domain-containing protein [Candidatus Limnocylindria bacterium]
MERRDPYRILQVQPDADPDVVKAAYRVLARKLHPDAGTLLDAGREQQMADLNWAYSVVRDPVKRAVWESDRRRAPPPTPAERATHGAPRGPLSADGGDQRLDFGRYEGWTLGEVAQRDPDYLDWLRRHASGARYRDAIDILLRKYRSAAR